MAQYIIAQWYVLIVQKLCALATVYLLLFELNMNEWMHAWMNEGLAEKNIFSCVVVVLQIMGIAAFLW